MARPLRIEYDGALYHITGRGNERKAIYRDDTDRVLFLNTLGRITDRFHWLCHAYCLMNNHYHLVVETPDGNLSQGMRQLNGVYTQAFNRRHHRAGHLFQGRFKAVLVQKDSHFLEVCRYVVLNPVRAKSVSNVRRWKWSSYRGTAGLGSAHPCLTSNEILSQFGRHKAQAQVMYRQFISEGIGGASIWGDLKGQSLLGVQGFVEELLPHVTARQGLRELPQGQRFVARPPLERLFKTARSKAARDKKIAEAVTKYGYRQIEIAEHLGLHYSTVSRLLQSDSDQQE